MGHFRFLNVLCLLLAGLHTVIVAGRWWPEPLHTFVADSAYIAVIFMSFLVVLMGWRRERQRQAGLGWAVLSMFFLLLAEGWMLQYDLSPDLPDFSVADPLYFLSYFTMAAALLRFNGLRGWSLGAWGALLDSLTVVVVAGELAWISFLGMAMSEEGASLLLRVINLTYVGFDLLLLGLTLLALRRRFSLPMVLFGTGLLGFVAADFLYFARTMAETYQAGTLHDTLWAWGTAFQALGVVWTWQERAWELPVQGGTSRAETLSTWRQDQVLAALPYLAMGINCALLLWHKGSALNVWSVLLFLIVLARQAVTNFERERLHRKLLLQARELEYRSLHDPLTGLANRAAFEQRLHAHLAEPDAETAALLYLDLDGFKLVNDTLGHSAGDQTLRWVAAQLQRAMPPETFVARLGGDEFTVLLPVIAAWEAEQAAAEIQAALARPIEGLARPMQVSASIGIALMRLGTSPSPEAIWQEADQAMYRVKQAGKRNKKEAIGLASS